jgi:hypothetical protein
MSAEQAASANKDKSVENRALQIIRRAGAHLAI